MENLYENRYSRITIDPFCTGTGTNRQSDTSGDPLMGGAEDSGTFVDSRDDQYYPWIRIRNQVWMAENLRYLPSVSPSSYSDWDDIEPRYYVYEYEGSSISEAQATNNYKRYGVLYNWSSSRFSVCPPGWHVPSDEEWKTIERNLGMSNSDADASDLRSSGSVGGQLKQVSTSHWLSPNSGATDAVFFTALPGGLRFPGGGFGYLGNDAFFWSSSSGDASNGWYRSVTYLSDGVCRSTEPREAGFSVRCIKDQ